MINRDSAVQFIPLAEAPLEIIIQRYNELHTFEDEVERATILLYELCEVGYSREEATIITVAIHRIVTGRTINLEEPPKKS
jgi:hypothetical protein